MNIFQQVFANVGQSTNIIEVQTLQPQQMQHQNVAKPTKQLSQIQTKKKSSLEGPLRQPLKQTSNKTARVSFEPKNAISSRRRKESLKATACFNKENDAMNRLKNMKDKIEEVNLQIKEKQNEMKKMKENNERLSVKNQELEILIEKMNAAANETNSQINHLQDEFDQEDEERTKFWEYRYMELKFQIEAVKEEGLGQ